jgi:putative membrane protein
VSAAPPSALAPPAPTASDVPWTRLSIRVVYLNLLQAAVSLVPGFVGAVVLDGSGPVRPLLLASAGGVFGALLDLLRWMTTRFRVTGERVELRTGRLARKYRTVPRDRVRSVDSSAKLRHRLFAVRVVHIGSGESDTSFKLDALTAPVARALQRELMAGARRPAADPATDPASDPATQDRPETVIARFRWRWVALNSVSLSAVFFVAGPLFGAYWFLRPFGVDLWDIAGRVLDWQTHGVARTVAVCLAVAFPLGVVAAAIGFVLDNWRFALVRAGSPPATALITRKGALTTRTTHRDDRRIRGLAFTESLAWRWLHLVETHVVTTGLGTGDASPGGRILPRTTMREARDLAGHILPDGCRPLDAPLRRHPRGALVRRLLMACYVPAGAAAALAVFAATGALPGWVWPIPLALLPVTVPLAVVAYRSLGHTLTGPYLVLRRGALSRSTVALQRRAVIGWTVEQSIFQRWGGRATVGVATAAGSRYYMAPDAGMDQALALVRGADPELAEQFLIRS